MKTLLLILIPFLGTSQLTFKTFVDRYKVSAPMMFVSGMVDGMNETITHHYPRFEAVHPNANPQYWNPNVSWRNKYDRGLTGIGVSLTDAYHLSRAIDRGLKIGVIPIMGMKERTEWWWYALDVVVLFTAERTGFWIVHDVIYND